MTHIPETYNGAPDPVDPKSAYGIGKRTAEYLCTAYSKQHGLHTTIARGFAFVGPGLPLDAHFAIGNFIRDALQDSHLIIKGDGTPYRSYLYAADLAIWLWTILLRGRVAYPYNVGSEAALSIAELAQRVAQNLNVNATVEIRAKAKRDVPVERYVPATQRAQMELNLAQWVNLDISIKQTAAWAKAIYKSY